MGVFDRFWRFLKGDMTPYSTDKRYKLTEKENARANMIWDYMNHYGVEIGDPAAGGHWWNWDKWDSDSTHSEPDMTNGIMFGEREKCRVICRRFEMLSKALYDAGYPYDLVSCIRYWVICPSADDYAITDGRNIAFILDYLWSCPDMV